MVVALRFKDAPSAEFMAVASARASCGSLPRAPQHTSGQLRSVHTKSRKKIATRRCSELCFIKSLEYLKLTLAGQERQHF